MKIFPDLKKKTTRISGSEGKGVRSMIRKMNYEVRSRKVQRLFTSYGIGQASISEINL